MREAFAEFLELLLDSFVALMLETAFGLLSMRV